MTQRMSALRGRRVVATDGPAGVLNDLYFDARGWAARYLAIDSGERSPGRRLLVSAAAATVREDGTIALALARAQASAGAARDAQAQLLSGREVCGYRLEAPDGPIGQVEDLLVDDDWSLAGLVASTRDWLLPGRNVEIAAHAVAAVDRPGRKLRIDLRRAQMRSRK